MSSVIGNNINGPSLIRVPDWVEAPLGRHYLYFAHHEGRSIRLAYADALTGPWHIHESGALSVEASGFPYDQSQIVPDPAFANALSSYGVTDYLPHIASPDVLIDHENNRILMYYHGMMADGDQKSRLAISKDGLHFRPEASLIDHYYHRMFRYGGMIYSVAWGGYVYRAPDWTGPFERCPSVLEGAPVCIGDRVLRHPAVVCEGDLLHLFFSRIGDAPETILHVTVKLADHPEAWVVRDVVEVLRPLEDWEGAHLPIEPSRPGVNYSPEHALRDPCVFRDEDGRLMMLYTGAAEQAIGIVELK